MLIDKMRHLRSASEQQLELQREGTSWLGAKHWLGTVAHAFTPSIWEGAAAGGGVISERNTVLVHTLEQGDKSRDFRMSQPHSVTLVT